MSFIRAFSFVNCQLILASLLFLLLCHAYTSVLTLSMVAICLFRHCPFSTCNSISAMFSQLPCFNSLLHGKRFPRIIYQLFGRFVHADRRVVFLIGSFIDIKNPLHAGNEVAALFRRYYPAFYFPRLKFVFFSTSHTLTWEMLSI